MSRREQAGTAAQEAYAALLAHELRTPAAAIQMAAQLLGQEQVIDNPAKRREWMEMIGTAAERLSRTITELTDFGAITGGRGAAEVLHAAVTLPQMITALAGERPIQVDLTDEAAAAPLDVTRLSLILRVLLDNAYEFGAAETPVRVEGVVAGDPPTLVVRVVNEGEPIPDEVRASIFEAFAQAEHYRTRRHQGLGLGLTIARRAAEGVGGRLELQPGAPTTFQVTLPLGIDPLARELRDQADLANRQALRAIQDARTQLAARRAYERLLPARLDPAQLTRPAPVLVDATVVFTDLRGFTATGERFADNPEALLDIVNEHFGVVVRAITKCGGIVEKFVGDGVLATFGARTDQPDHRERALAAAIGAVGANEALNRRRAQTWGFRLDMGVGLASGPVVVGGVGPAERWEMGILGDPVNTAARLVAQARAGEVVLTSEAYCDVARMVAAEVLGPTKLRGRIGAVDLVRIPVLHSPTA